MWSLKRIKSRNSVHVASKHVAFRANRFTAARCVTKRYQYMNIVYSIVVVMDDEAHLRR
jgi:hypothetical protein